jgi:transcriptional regulator with XRE-family HTH domain
LLAVVVDAGELAAERVRVRALRRGLGEHLATYRTAAGVSQPELARALGRTRSTVSKVEHGTRGMPARLWEITDEVCRAEGALVSEHTALVRAGQDYRGRCRAHQRQARQAAAQAGADALRALSASHTVREGDQGSGYGTWPGTMGVASELLGDAASLASLSPRLTAELHATRALMQPWKNIHAVTTLDATLHTYGLTPTAAPGW